MSEEEGQEGKHSSLWLGSHLFPGPAGLTWQSGIFWIENFTAQLQGIIFNVKPETPDLTLTTGVGAQFILGHDS